MPDFNEAVGTFLRIDCEDGDWFAVQPHDESVIRKAVQDYREKGIDSLVELEHRMGYPVHIVASHVAAFYPCSPEIRAATLMEEIREDEWRNEFRKAHAVKGWEE